MSAYYRARATGLLVPDGTEILVYAPFSAKGALKALPVRRWDAARRCWIVPAALRSTARRVLEAHCDLIEDRCEPETGWLSELFLAVPPRYFDAVYRALSMALHPDHGGNHRLMTALNRLHERHRGARAAS